MNKIYILKCSYPIHGFDDVIVVMAKSPEEARQLIEQDHQNLYANMRKFGEDRWVKWCEQCFQFQEIEITPTTSTILYGRIS